MATANGEKPTSILNPSRSSKTNSNGVAATIVVWDRFVRTFHWCLVVSFTIAFVSADDWRGVHLAAGYAASVLVALRIVWGVAGPRFAQFRQFVRRPVAIAVYLSAVAGGRAPRYLGHNPAGGAMVVALLAALSLLSLSGWLLTTDLFWGSAFMDAAHDLLADFTLILVIVHICGVAYSSFQHRENLVLAMITGRKPAPRKGMS